MTKLIHITDIHFESSPIMDRGNITNSELLLESMIKHIQKFHSNADACVVTGDLVNDGGEESYAKVFHALNSLGIKIIIAAGNHDNRGTIIKFKSKFDSLVCEIHNGFIQYSYDIFYTRILSIDTNNENPDDKCNFGSLCKHRLEWLDKCLSSATTPTILLMHHSPIDTGIAFMDRFCLESKGELAAVIAKHSHVKHIFFGHVHRCIAGHFSGISCSTPGSCSSNICIQSINTFIESNDSPSYGLVLINDDCHPKQWSLTAHRVPFLIDDQPQFFVPS